MIRQACTRLAVSAPGLLALAVLAPTTAFAESQTDGWQWRGILYGWFPSVGGETNFPVSTGGESISVDASEILDALSGVFMGSLEVQKGAWGGFTNEDRARAG
jgi:hypothetical protein